MTSVSGVLVTSDDSTGGPFCEISSWGSKNADTSGMGSGGDLGNEVCNGSATGAGGPMSRMTGSTIARSLGEVMGDSGKGVEDGERGWLTVEVIRGGEGLAEVLGDVEPEASPIAKVAARSLSSRVDFALPSRGGTAR